MGHTNQQPWLVKNSQGPGPSAQNFFTGPIHIGPQSQCAQALGQRQPGLALTLQTCA